MPYYLCSYRHRRGAPVCDNDRTARAEEAEERLLSAIETKILTPAAIDRVIDLAVEQISTARKAAPYRRAQIEEDAKRLRRVLDRLAAVIAAGQSSQTILAEIMHREERLQALAVERERLTITLVPAGRDLERVRAATIEQAIRFREALRGELHGARDALQKLIPRPVSFIPD